MHIGYLFLLLIVVWAIAIAREYAPRDRSPEAILRQHLLHALVLTDLLLSGELRPADRYRLVRCLETIATTLDTKLRLARTSGDKATDKAFHEQVRLMADLFRTMKLHILLPDPEGVSRVLTSLIQAIRAEAKEDWRLMPKVSREQSDAQILIAGGQLVSVAVISVPILLAILLVSLFTHEVNVWVVLVVIVIAVVSLRLLGGEPATLAAEDLLQLMKLVVASWTGRRKERASRMSNE